MPVLAIGMIATVLSFGVYWGLPTYCVQLPNGLNIGKQALIDLSRPYFRPDIVPKFDNGQSLLPGDAWPFFSTETTVHGLAEETDPQDDFWFAWRKDTGLVLKAENPALGDDSLPEFALGMSDAVFFAEFFPANGTSASARQPFGYGRCQNVDEMKYCSNFNLSEVELDVCVIRCLS